VRLTTAQRLRETPVDCARWAAEEPSGSLEDLENSTLARYSAFIRGTGYESPPQTFDRAADLLLSYRLFPAEVIESTVCTPDARIALGAVVVQRSFVGPLAVESAVRVEAMEDDLTFAGRRLAFSVVTLRGHPLRGAETIALLMHETGRIELHFTSASRPAGLLARLGGPFTRRMQVRANRAAFAYFRSLVADTGPRAEPPSPRNAQRLTLWETSDLQAPVAEKTELAASSQTLPARAASQPDAASSRTSEDEPSDDDAPSPPPSALSAGSTMAARAASLAEDEDELMRDEVRSDKRMEVSG
jgi:uncharacterized protein (UPF0548 family)